MFVSSGVFFYRKADFAVWSMDTTPLHHVFEEPGTAI
jgi:hypothetical protein